MKRGLLPSIMIVLITVIGLVNFFAPFLSEYKTVPLITYFFLFTAGSIAGYQGVAAILLNWIKDKIPEQEKIDKKEPE